MCAGEFCNREVVVIEEEKSVMEVAVVIVLAHLVDCQRKREARIRP